MDGGSGTLTYKKNMTKSEVLRIIAAIGIPLAVLGLGMYAISSFANFGEKIICPLSGAMWSAGFFAALFVPSQRAEIMNQTMAVCTLYYMGLLGLKILLGLSAGVSTEMIAASYNQAIPVSTGNAMTGWLQNVLWFSAFGIPIGQVSMQGKRLFMFQKSRSLERTFRQRRGLRNSGRENTRSIR